MPIFEYRCAACGHEFETILFQDDPEPVECPRCQAKEISRLMSAGSFRPQGIARGSGGFKAPSCRPSGGG